MLTVCFNSGDIPAMTDLIDLTGKTRTINVPKEIGVKWFYVGTALLNDTIGVVVPALDQTYRGDTERINFEILR